MQSRGRLRLPPVSEPDARFTLITYLKESGSFVSDGQTTMSSIELQMTSVTVA